MILFDDPIEFEWDKGNRGKNEKKHGIPDQECEEAFFDQDKKIFRDSLHSQGETRYILFGATKSDRKLFIVFTMRQHRIRIISVRNLSKKERSLYEKTN